MARGCAVNGYIEFNCLPTVLSYASCVGSKEKSGPLGEYFDLWSEDTSFGEKTWEQSESRLQEKALLAALDNGALEPTDIDAVFGGDLQAQCTASHYNLADKGIPFAGLYGACSTMAESLLFACAFVDAGFIDRAAAITSSHFCAAERQFRFPLEYGGMRTPTSQWTATASGCVVVGAGGKVSADSALIGRINDYNITDINNMGAAMAPAAADTVLRYLSESGRTPDYYDLIVTGDLGVVGSELFLDLMGRDGVHVYNHVDCGAQLYELDNACVRAGGSGCGCSAAVLCSVLLPRLESRRYKRILFAATGALMSTTLFQQGRSIPSVCHAVSLNAPS